jgi:transglutaminase-like putative cysteine protease
MKLPMPRSSLPGVDANLILREQVRYTYDRPIRHLHHRLMVIPRGVHGDQIRHDFGVTVSDERADVTITHDEFSNCVIHVSARSVVDEIVFSAWATVSTRATPRSFEPLSLVRDHRFLRPTSLTHPNERIANIGRELAASGESPSAIGKMACGWAHRAISYGYGCTGVHTSAAEALALGEGVCQDYAHIMLAVCHAAGVPARYVSGHLTGEGGSHAWVEVLEAAPSGAGTIAMGFDPTHDRAVDSRYLTVAVGRNYSDVAPTSGTFRGPACGLLDVKKLVTKIAPDGAPLQPVLGSLPLNLHQ